MTAKNAADIKTEQSGRGESNSTQERLRGAPFRSTGEKRFDSRSFVRATQMILLATTVLTAHDAGLIFSEGL
jgi:hypothetical protein